MPLRSLVRLTPFAVFAIAACSEGGPGPRSPGSLQVVSGAGQSAFAGETLDEPLVVRVRGRDGQPLGGIDVTWTVTQGGGSIQPITSRSNASGLAEAEWTLGSTVGEQVATATVGSLTPARFEVEAAPPFADPSCFGAPLVLAVGGTQSFTGTSASEICVSAGPGGGEYVAVVHHGDFSTDEVALTARGVLSGAIVSEAPVAPSMSRAASTSTTRSGAGLEERRNEGFHASLRARERELAPMIPAARAARSRRSIASTTQPRFAIGGANPQIGDVVTINAQSSSACSSPINKQGRIAAISDYAIVVHDNGNPTGGFTDAEYASIAQTFDQLIHPLEIAAFGAPSDIDGNGRAFIFYTNEVNKLTERGSNSYVGGFYFARDLFPKVGNQQMQGCASSNEAEIFYMLVPDPNATVSDARTKEFVLRVTLGTIAHEYQHLINASRRIFVNDAPGFEETWLDEGLSHVAEELVFYEASGYAPRQNIDLADVRASSTTLEAFNRYGISNVFRFEDFLEAPSTNSPYNTDDELATRGAAWAFLRYLADRRANEQAFWWDLVNGQARGLMKLEQVLGGPVHPWARDWTTAVLLDDLVAGAAAIHTMPSWNLRDIWTANPPFSGTYPLAIANVSGGSPVTRTVIGGGAAYLRFTMGINATGAFQVRTDGGVPAPDITVTVVRTR